MHMTYTDRTQIIGTWLQQALRRYEAPLKMDQETRRKELTFIVQDVNSNIASHVHKEQLISMLDRIEAKIRGAHGSRSWPTIKTFIECTKKVSTDLPASSTETYSLDPLRINEKRIRKGEPISELYLTNKKMRADLIEKTSITNEDLKNYTLPTIEW